MAATREERERFGALLRQTRRSRHLTQAELAQAISDEAHKVPPQSVSNWERGIVAPESVEIVRILDNLLLCNGELLGSLGYDRQLSAAYTPQRRQGEQLEELLTRLSRIEDRLSALESPAAPHLYAAEGEDRRRPSGERKGARRTRNPNPAVGPSDGEPGAD